MTAAGAARPGWARTAATSLVVGLATSGSIFAGMVALAPAASAADDSSAVTVTAAEQDPDLATAPFPDLSVTVSQTQDLMSQGITLTYSGGKQSTVPNLQVAGSNFIQIMQCWGDLRDAQGNLVLDAEGNPQPDRTTCQYGSSGIAGQTRSSTKGSVDEVAPEDEPYMYPGIPFLDPPSVSIPFRAVNGKTLAEIADGKFVPGVDLVTNEFYTPKTTNEVAWAGFSADGSGIATFEVQTNMQAPGLGCGIPIASADGTTTGQACWLVVVPRGENDAFSSYITKSALLWETWKHRLAVRLDFRPLGVRCALGAAERSTAGSELIAQAVASWQPQLCGSENGSIYNLIITNEADVAAQANGDDLAPLAFTSRALADSSPDATDNLVYAPVAVTGLAVAFAVDHFADAISPDVPQSVKALDQQPFTQMNLTPRLVAKLLTYSYKSSLPSGADKSHLDANPENITRDPEFLKYNPDWAYQALNSPAIADLLAPLGRSDSAMAVWRYVMADAEARDFLAGTPDEWGMVVNPWASTNAELNPAGTGMEYPSDSFPKADPTEVDNNGDVYGRSVVGVVTWRPYAPDLDTAGYWVLRGDGRLLGNWDQFSNPPKFSMASRSLSGFRAVLGVTDTASAEKYNLFTAALRNPAGEFVVPTVESMTAAAQAMRPASNQTDVLAFDGTSNAALAAQDAYPLTLPVYAATNPAGGDAASRAAYARLIRYAVNEGQISGADLGQLPPGYAPLPASWRAQALSAADTIAAGGTAPTSTPTAASTPSATPTPSLPDSTPPSGLLPTTDTPAAAQPGEPTEEASPTPTAAPSTEPPRVAVGAATPDDSGGGLLSAAVPISALGGALAAGAVPLVARPRRTP